jgi:DNA-binding PadR family transcriptional regulator
MAKIAKLPTLTRTEKLILETLATREMYGLQLVAASRGKLKRGTVYVLLGRMEEKGFVESAAEEKPQHSGLPRRLYRATGLGRRVLDAWSLVATTLGFGGAHA